MPLVKAIYWLESAYVVEGKDCASSLLKNLGLAHLHAVQSKIIPDELLIQETIDDLLDTSTLIDWPASGQR